MLSGKLAIGSALLLLAGLLVAATPGTFRGTVINAPQDGKWVYVQSSGGVTRRVDISQARVVFDHAVPSADRSKTPIQALPVGTQVRVTAVQDGSGEWKATEVEVLKAAPR